MTSSRAASLDLRPPVPPSRAAATSGRRTSSRALACHSRRQGLPGPTWNGRCGRRRMLGRGPCCPTLTSGMGGARGEEPALLLPPSLTAAGEPHPLPMERTSLTVSVVICTSTEDRWPLLQGSVSSPESDPDGDHRLRRSQRLTSRGVPTAQGHWGGNPSVRDGGAGQVSGSSSRFGPKFGS